MKIFREKFKNYRKKKQLAKSRLDFKILKNIIKISNFQAVIKLKKMFQNQMNLK